MHLVSNYSETLESFKVNYFIIGALFLITFCSSRAPHDRPVSMASDTPLIDQSFTKLKDVVLQWDKQNIQWIATTLQTASSGSLRQTTVHPYTIIVCPVSKTVLRV